MAPSALSANPSNLSSFDDFLDMLSPSQSVKSFSDVLGTRGSIMPGPPPSHGRALHTKTMQAQRVTAAWTKTRRVLDSADQRVHIKGHSSAKRSLQQRGIMGSWAAHHFERENVLSLTCHPMYIPLLYNGLMGNRLVHEVEPRPHQGRVLQQKRVFASTQTPSQQRGAT